MIPYQKFTDTHAKDSNYILLPPKKVLEIDAQLQKKLAAALVTRYSPDGPQMKISMVTASRHIPASLCQWGQAQVCGGGDQFKCHALLKGQQWVCDCMFVKVNKIMFPCHTHPTNHETISTKLKLISMNVKSTGHQ